MRLIGQQVVDGGNRVKQETAEQMLRGLLDIQPKDTGEATAGWRIGIGQQDTTDFTFVEGKHGSTAQANIGLALATGRLAIAQATPGVAIHVGNIVEHVKYNNEGNSQQAPAGYVENEVVTATYYLQKKARIFKKVKRARKP